jgi:four helix bundle protein
MNKRIDCFQELNVYKEAIKLQQEIFKLTKNFPKEEVYNLVDQIRRAARSIGANIAEAWHKRRYPAHFVSKLTDADAEQAETQHWLGVCLECEYISKEDFNLLFGECKKIGSMLGAMMSKPEKFCT